MPDAAPTVADDTRLVLLAVRLRGVLDRAALDAALAAMAVAVADADVLAGRLELAGLVEHREGGHPGWRLLPDGRAEGERLLAEELDRHGARAEVTAAYDRFVGLNGPLIRACTDWQLRDANPSALVVNDHADPAYDDEVIGRLGVVHERVVPVCDVLAGALDRFGGYGTRFGAAMDRVRSGDRVGFDSPGTASFHSVWFELHENLLATLGRDRSAEPLPDTSTNLPAPPP